MTTTAKKQKGASAMTGEATTKPADPRQIERWIETGHGDQPRVSIAEVLKTSANSSDFKPVNSATTEVEHQGLVSIGLLASIERCIRSASLLAEMADAHVESYRGCEIDREDIKAIFEMIRLKSDEAGDLVRELSGGQ